MASDIRIRRARGDDAGALTDIAHAAKRHWGYPESWIRAWAAALTFTPDYIDTHPTFVAVKNDEIVGFCALILEPDGARLDQLWVLPKAMGGGVGRALFVQAETAARAAGATCLRIVGDPHAEGFYQRMGASGYGREPAPMDGRERFFPLLRKVLE
jgi:predicted N-acetyltransferase YhbS